MNLDFLQHFRTKLGRRIVILFVLCALLPTVALSLASYTYSRGQLEDGSTRQMRTRTEAADQGALQMLQSVESELILLTSRQAWNARPMEWSTFPVERRLLCGGSVP